MSFRTVLGTPQFSDVTQFYTPTLGGGSWQLPLTNLQDRRLGKVARSTDALAASTQFVVDLGVARGVGVLALQIVNVTKSSTPTIRWRAWSAAPVVNWPRVGDAGWTALGTPTRVLGETLTTVNGIYLDRIGDDDAAATENYHRNISFTGNGDKAISFLVRRFSAHGFHSVTLIDSTASATRLAINIDFQTSTPVVTASSGSVVSVTAEDTGYRIVVKATGVVAANVNVFAITPSSNSPLDFASFQIGDITVWDIDTNPTVYDSGGLRAWPAGLTAEGTTNYNVWQSHVPASVQTARYLGVDIADQGNVDGFLDISRLYVMGRYAPGIGPVPGLSVGIDDPSIVTKTDGGSYSVLAKRKGRTHNMILERVPESEAFGEFFDMQMTIGVTEEVFVVFNEFDTPAMMAKRSYPCLLTELTPLEYPYAGLMENKTAVKTKEWI